MCVWFDLNCKISENFKDAIIFKFNFNIQQNEQKRQAAVHLSQQLSRNKSGIIQLYDKQVMVLVYGEYFISQAL